MAIKTKTELLAEAATIRDETTTGANTATRVGQHLYDVIDTTDDAKISKSSASPVAFTGALAFTDKQVKPYDNYDVSVGGTITFSIGGSAIPFGIDYLKIVSDGVTAFAGATNLDAIFDEQYNVPDDYILPAGTFACYMWKTPAGAAISFPGNASAGAPAGTAPTILSIVIPSSDLTEIRFNFDRNVNASSLAGMSLVGTTDTSPTYVSGSGTSQLIGSLGTAATELETITANYNSAAGNIVSSADSTPLESFIDEDVSVADTIAPTLITISIGDVADNIVNYIYDENLANVVPLEADLLIKYDDVTQTHSSRQIIGNVVRVTLVNSATPDTVVKAAYTQSSGNEIQDAAGNLASNITEGVINNLLDYGELYLDADAANLTLGAADVVDAWDDLSDNADQFTPDTNKAVWQDAIINGLPVVTFASDNNYKGTSGRNYHSKNGLTGFIVVRSNLSGANRVIFNTFNGTSVTGFGGDIYSMFRGIRLETDSFEVSEDVQESASIVNYTELIQGNWYIIAVRWIPGIETAAFINAVKSVAAQISGYIEPVPPNASPPNINGDPLGPGSYLSGSTFVGNIPYLQFFNRAWSDGEIKDKIDALKATYGQTIDTSSLSEAALSLNGNPVIGRQGNDRIRIYLNGIANPNVTPSTSAFSISGITGSPTISSVEVGVNWIDVTLSSDAVDSDTITVDYTKPGTDPVQSPKGEELASFSGQAVDNYVLDDSGYDFVIDARDDACIQRSADTTWGYDGLTIDTITDKIGSVVGSKNDAGMKANLYPWKDGLRKITNRILGTASASQRQFNFGNIKLYDNTNGLTYFFVIKSRATTLSTTTDLLGKWNSFGTNREILISGRVITIWDGATSQEAAYADDIPPNTPAILAARWIPGTELSIWRDGVEGTPLTTSVFSAINPAGSTNMFLFGMDTNDNPADVDLFYFSALKTAVTNQVLKDTIDKLGNIWGIPVDTSGISV